MERYFADLREELQTRISRAVAKGEETDTLRQRSLSLEREAALRVDELRRKAVVRAQMRLRNLLHLKIPRLFLELHLVPADKAAGVSQPLTLNLAYNHSPPGRTGEVTGLRLTINNVTHIGVPIAAGSLAAVLGVAPVFWTSAALLAVAGYLTRKA